MYVKIFEINTVNYFRTTGNQFDAELQLEGMIPHQEQVYEFDNLSQFEKEFKFPSLQNKRGLFVIEFIGNGKNTRAIIKKGNLTLLEMPSVHQQVFYILDEDKNICKDKSTGIWVQDVFYKCDILSGEIKIPFNT